MTKKRILICDDDEGFVKRIKKQLSKLGFVGKNFNIEPLENPKKAFDALMTRRMDARKNYDPSREFSSVNGCAAIDEADIFVVDYDLLNAKGISFLTGEELSYLARCYSRCGIIIGLNQFDHGAKAFDLTLRGYPESYADLNIGEPLLYNKGLWNEPWDKYSFRPWAWPLLSVMIDRFKSCVREVISFINQPILDFLGFQGRIALSLPRTSAEYLTISSPLDEITFEQFVKYSGNGLRGKDKPYSEEAIARIAASRLNAWLEYYILSGQDILVDAPHLIARYPSLLGNKSNDIVAWNKTATLKNFEKVKVDNLAQPFRFKRTNWISRPAWFWSEVSKCEDIREVSDPWSIQRPDWVFCEDISRFLPREATREFVADLSSQFNRRYVVDYKTSQGKDYASELESINYKPVIRFSI